MSHPLDGCRAKIERADQHITNLKSEVQAFVRHLEGTNPPVRQFNPQTGQHEYILQLGTDPPLIVSILAGEVLYHLRSSLDHLIGQLLRANKASESALRMSEFPVFVDGAKYPTYGRRKIQGVSDEATTLIDKLQPCYRTDGLPADDHPLAVLHALNNIDKHRLLLLPVVDVVTDFAEVTATHSGPYGVGLNIPKNRRVVFGSTKDVAQRIVSVFLPGPILEPINVEVKVGLSFDVAFEKVGTREVQPVIPTLTNLREVTSDIVGTFQKRFFG
jgi:hypothetical protein